MVTRSPGVVVVFRSVADETEDVVRGFVAGADSAIGRHLMSKSTERGHDVAKVRSTCGRRRPVRVGGTGPPLRTGPAVAGSP